MPQEESIEESHTARLSKNHDQCRALAHRNRALLRRDKKRYVTILAEDVKGNLNAKVFRPVY